MTIAPEVSHQKPLIGVASGSFRTVSALAPVKRRISSGEYSRVLITVHNTENSSAAPPI